MLQRLAAVDAVASGSGGGAPAHGQGSRTDAAVPMTVSLDVAVAVAAASVAAVERGLILVGIHGSRLQGTFVVVGVRATVVDVVRVAVCVVGVLL